LRPLIGKNPIWQTNSWSHGDTVDILQRLVIQTSDDVEQFPFNIDGPDDTKPDAWHEYIRILENVKSFRFERRGILRCQVAK
jgi:hypothetical protein